MRYLLGHFPPKRERPIYKRVEKKNKAAKNGIPAPGMKRNPFQIGFKTGSVLSKNARFGNVRPWNFFLVLYRRARFAITQTPGKLRDTAKSRKLSHLRLIRSINCFATIHSTAGSGSQGIACERRDRKQRSLCQGVPFARQEQEISNQGSQEKFKSDLQWNVHLQVRWQTFCVYD